MHFLQKQSHTFRMTHIFEPDDPALIYSDGYVSFNRRNVLEGHCLVDYVSFPFDRQVCQIQFSLERYFDPISDPGFDVALMTREGSERKLYEWFENEQWDLVKVTQETRNYTYRKSQHKSQKPELLLNNTDIFVFINFNTFSFILVLHNFSHSTL